MSDYGQQPPGGGGWGAPPGGGFPAPQQMGPGPGGRPQQTEVLAIVSLVTGILSFVSCACCSFIPLIGIVGNIGSALIAVGAVVTGVLAMKKIDADPSLGGKPLALAGTIIGGIALLLIVVSIILIIVGVGFSAATSPRY